MDPALENELRAMLDREAIAGLIHAYCRAVDRKDVAACRQLYHPDALDDHGSYYQGDAAGYLDKLPEIMAPVVMMQHHITTVNIKLDGDYAESEAYGLAIHQIQGAAGLEDLLVGTRFFDKFERRHGKWKILHRGHAMDWIKSIAPSAFSGAHQQAEGSPRGRADASDPSYGFFRLFQRNEA
jgi:ketosteroid isomerase-like protein